MEQKSDSKRLKLVALRWAWIIASVLTGFCFEDAFLALFHTSADHDPDHLFRFFLIGGLACLGLVPIDYTIYRNNQLAKLAEATE